jgi:hypothetical protein
MGVGYYKNFTLWTIGASSEGCSVIQNDINIISNGFNNIGFRTDEHGNTREKSTLLGFVDNNFASNGIINNATDRDFFKVVIQKRTRLRAKITPNNVAVDNSGANVDLFLTLMKYNGDTIGRYNPKSILNASVDTTITAGTYYLGVDGMGNQNVSDYGSVGLYSLSGSLENIVVAPTVLLKGDVRRNINVINWDIQSTQGVRSTYIEYSLDGRFYTPFTDVPANTSTYLHQPLGGNAVYYRLRMVMSDERNEYSNVVVLSNVSDAKVTLMSNIVRSTAMIKCSGEYSYQLIDETGRLLKRGRLTAGINAIPLTVISNGLVLLKVFDQREQFHYRIIKQ